MQGRRTGARRFDTRAKNISPRPRRRPGGDPRGSRRGTESNLSCVCRDAAAATKDCLPSRLH
ncbi:hypothetical protein [Lysobacter gummosus]|uniref:hypothetical protein n=1 Tax=Lysobacter gummosus TaxID=262324 RepID=UPI00362EB2C8